MNNTIDMSIDNNSHNNHNVDMDDENMDMDNGETEDFHNENNMLKIIESLNNDWNDMELLESIIPSELP